MFLSAYSMMGPKRTKGIEEILQSLPSESYGPGGEADKTNTQQLKYDEGNNRMLNSKVRGRPVLGKGIRNGLGGQGCKLRLEASKQISQA